MESARLSVSETRIEGGGCTGPVKGHWARGNVSVSAPRAGVSTALDGTGDSRCFAEERSVGTSAPDLAVTGEVVWMEESAGWDGEQRTRPAATVTRTALRPRPGHNQTAERKGEATDLP